MQRTATEHTTSAFANVACSSCHMPATHPKHRSHTFAVTDAMLRSAVVADVARAGPASIAMRLAPGRVGHAMPTGDMFRRLVIEAELIDQDGTVHARRRRDLARSFGVRMNAHGVPSRADVADDRVGAGLEPCFEMDFAPVREIAHATIHLELAYERVAHPLGPRPERAAVASRVVLLSKDFDLTTASSWRACVGPK